MNLRLSAAMLLVLAIPGIVLAPKTASAQNPSNAPVRVVIVGLEHGHAGGLLSSIPDQKNVELVGISEANTALAERYARQFHLDKKIFFTDTDQMLTQLHPDAVLVYTAISDHRKVIEIAARHGIMSMVEKPLATTMADAIAIRRVSEQHHVPVLVNYETTWYPSNTEAYRQVEAGKLGAIRRVVVHDGHEGPKEIHVGPEFLKWLTDPAKNGAGAMFDFGCYGADLMTWMMHGETPISVTAVALTDKPDIYPKVDDDATIIVRYPKAQLVLQPSWNWPFARKDMEVYGATGYAITVAADDLRVRYAGEKAESSIKAPPLTENEQSSLDYLVAVFRGQIHPQGDLNSLDTNMVVMQILTAARESVKSGRTIELKPLPKQ
ncbi:Gfo/Idh/MocA family protein [Acidicapsa ligni]|uniref:Gfo/Idh/MocA family protein n=1 Tax=Acidicapsa ligni TaxID=542300 RepID=UPI0021DF5EC8|nr:Gfo/Idh/MocA family oxidoreductase [Acidicapsa ligni]